VYDDDEDGDDNIDENDCEHFAVHFIQDKAHTLDNGVNSLPLRLIG
jgi:hypothetical protein